MATNELTPGTIVGGDFVVERLLSAGGMGAVYVCFQKSTEKRRALKVMLPELMQHPSLRDRFVQEARVGARIASDHIVDVVGAGLDPVPWLAMELLDGEDLERRVGRDGRIDLEMTRAILEQACHALAAAHAAGVVHRDLKPANLFLARSNQVGAPFKLKILDFGIAKIANEASTSALKNTAAMGTRPWMAPEQSAVGETIGPQADVWALGLIAFYLLTGRFYWRAIYDPNTNDMMLMREIWSGSLDPATARATLNGAAAGALPEGFDAWFARCVAREQSARFRDAGEAFRAFADVGAGTRSVGPEVVATPLPSSASGRKELGAQAPASGSTSGSTSRSTEPVVRRTSIAAYAAIGGALLLVPLAIFGIVKATGNGSPSSSGTTQSRADDGPDVPRTGPSHRRTVDPPDASAPSSSARASASPSGAPSASPSGAPSASPSGAPSASPSGAPSSASSAKSTKGTSSIGGAAVSGGKVSNASAVVAGMNAGFRACYNRGLAEDPEMRGTVRVTAQIGPGGEVTSVSTAGGGSISGTVIGCVQARVAGAQFAPPDPTGSTATITIPITFQPQS